MIKRDELSNPQSCMSRANDDEMTFVLLARDRVASIVIRVWAVLRVLFRKNKWRDAQIQEALQMRCNNETSKSCAGGDPMTDSRQIHVKEECCKAVCLWCRGDDKEVGKVLKPDGDRGWRHIGHAREYPCNAAAIRSMGE